MNPQLTFKFQRNQSIRKLPVINFVKKLCKYSLEVCKWYQRKTAVSEYRQMSIDHVTVTRYSIEL